MLKLVLNFDLKSINFRYTDNCLNLLTQFKTAFKLVEPEFRTVDDFVKKYKVFNLFQISLLRKLSFNSFQIKVGMSFSII